MEGLGGLGVRRQSRRSFVVSAGGIAGFAVLAFVGLRGGAYSIPPPAEAPPAEAVVVYVDAAIGVDAPEREGSEALPWRSLTYALGRVSESFDPDRSEGPCIEIWMAPGEYRDGEGTAAEAFPLRFPYGASSLRIASSAGAEPFGPVVIASSSAEAPTLEVIEWSDSEPREPERPLPELHLEGLTLRGGRTGVSTLVPQGAGLSVRLEDCSFEGQVAAAVEGWIAPEGRLEAAILRCTFRGCGGGISFETAASASVQASVVEGTFDALRAYGPDLLLGAGVDLHLDPEARIDARIERCIFRSVASAVQLTGAERPVEGSLAEGILRATIAGNLIVGSRVASPAPGGPSELDPASRGVYLSIDPRHDVGLVIASNTFVGMTGPVVFHDNLDVLEAAGKVVPLTFVNNLCHDTEAESELDVESILDVLSPEEADRIDVRGNLLERSRFLASGYNRAGEPRFVDPDAGDYRLRPDSPAVDGGVDDYSRVLSTDLDGRCRRSSRDCRLEAESYPMDLGAYELPGICDEEVRTFRRGDCNSDGGAVEISDAISVFGFLFLGSSEPPVLDACDSNDDGIVDITDGIYILSYLFAGGSPPRPPYESSGLDPTRDCLPSGSPPQE